MKYLLKERERETERVFAKTIIKACAFRHLQSVSNIYRRNRNKICTQEARTQKNQYLLCCSAPLILRITANQGAFESAAPAVPGAHI